MPLYSVKTPDGKIIKLQGPAGATDDQILAQAKRLGGGPPDPIVSATKALGSAAEGVVEGVTDVPVKLNQIATRALPFTGLRERQDEFVKEREGRIAKEQGNPLRGGMDLPRVAGNVIGTAPIAAVAPEGIAGAAAAGMAGGAAARPVTSENFWWETGKDATLGAAGGAALSAGAGAGAAGRAIAPKFGEAKSLLMREGVRLTPGQMARGEIGRAGDALRSGEQAFGGTPFLGSQVRHAEAESIATFNRAAWNRALQPLGLQVPNTVAMGRETAEWVSGQLNAAYDRIYPALNVRLDGTFLRETQDVIARARTALPAAQFEQFQRLVTAQGEKVARGGRIPGTVAKGMDSEFGREAAGRTGDPAFDVRAMGEFFRDMQTAFRGAMFRSASPDIQGEMRAANEAWSNYVRVMRASAATGSPNGVFTPAKLAAAVRHDDPSLRKMGTARGTALMQDLSDAGVEVLPRTVNDSGTAERAAWIGLLTGGSVFGEHITGGAALTAGALTAPYTAPGRALTNAWARPGPTREAARRAAEGVTPALAPAAGAVAADTLQPSPLAPGTPQ